MLSQSSVMSNIVIVMILCSGSVLAHEKGQFHPAPVDLDCQRALEDKSVSLLIGEAGPSDAAVDLWKTWLMMAEHSGLAPVMEKPFKVLNMASRRGEESYALSAFLGGKTFISPAANVKVYAVDVDEPSISLANATKAEINKQFPGVVDPVEFKIADLSAPESFTKVGVDKFNLLWVRHPQIMADYYGHPVWAQMFEGALEHLENAGYIWVTTYFLDEAEMVARTLTDFGAEIVVVPQLNKSARGPRDGYMLVARKPAR